MVKVESGREITTVYRRIRALLTGEVVKLDYHSLRLQLILLALIA